MKPIHNPRPKILLPAVLLALLCGCGGADKKAPKRPTAETLAALLQDGEPRQMASPADGDTIAILTTDAGEIRAVLYPDVAPMAVYNFAGLARTGYYDGTVFWRAQYGFAVQGGDATGTGSGGSTIWSNHLYPLEADETLRHYAGALCVAFADGGTEEGGTSQFYIVSALPDSVDKAMREQLTQNGYGEAEITAYAAAGGLPYLDNTDTVFGQVYAGMDVVDKIACAETERDETEADTFRPVTPVTIESITITTYPGPETPDEG